MLFCFDCLVNTVAETSARHKTACKVVYDDDLAVLNDVLLVLLEVAVSLQSVVDIVLKVEVIRI